MRSQVYYMGAGIFGIYLVSQYPIAEYFKLDRVGEIFGFLFLVSDVPLR